MRVCQSIQELLDEELLDEELSQMWEGLEYEGVCVLVTQEWFAQSDVFTQILEKLKEENK